MTSPFNRIAALVLLGMTSSAHAGGVSFLDDLKPKFTASTIAPSNGDTNPYGVVIVPEKYGPHGHCSDIGPGSTLVSNFSNKAGAKGTGNTIAMICHAGNTFNFFRGVPGLGLTSALGILIKGFVIVGNLPTSDGTCATAQAGSLLVVDKMGKLIKTISSPSLLNGPWALALHDEGSRALLFVSNVLNGTVSRIRLTVSDSNVAVQDITQIATSYSHRCDRSALVLGPTGLAYDVATDTLFVASTADNIIYSIHQAGQRSNRVALGNIVYNDPEYLRGPLALLLTPGGTLVTSNGDSVNADPAHPSELIEFTKAGQFVSRQRIDNAQGAAFGITLGVVDGKPRFEAVNNTSNTLEVSLAQEIP